VLGAFDDEHGIAEAFNEAVAYSLFSVSLLPRCCFTSTIENGCFPV
jgi:hypothetical protein